MRTDGKTFVIAEAGVNHNGSPELAMRLVEAAVAAGADAVKFQTFKAERLVSAQARMADYQVQNIGRDGGQMEMLRKLELPEAAHHVLADSCKRLGIAFMSTAFDVDSLDFLAKVSVPALKIPSGDVTAAPLVLATARKRLPIILSTGMCTLSDIETALGVIAFGLLSDSNATPSRQSFENAYASVEGQQALRRMVTLLHCVTEYPAPADEVNLRAMDTLSQAFGLPVGYSDHTQGTAIALAAVARGATVIEKHFTLDRNMPGPDHKASLEPSELIAFVKDIHAVELSLGHSQKSPSRSEWKNRPVARRSLVAACAISKGELFTESNLSIKRPGDGLSPVMFWDVLGRRADRDYVVDQKIEL